MRKLSLCVLLLTASLTHAGEKARAGFQWVTVEDGIIDLVHEEQPVLRYMHRYDPATAESLHNTYKVFHHVYGPGTKDLITKGPGGQYTHHRGMFLGFSKTKFEGKSLDFWHCKNGAHLKHHKVLKQHTHGDMAWMATEIHWNDADGKPVIIEERTVTARRVPIDAKPGYKVVVDFVSQLQSQRGKIELNGDRQHAGFQFRAAQEVAEKKSARYVRPEGFPQQPEAFQVGDQGNPPKHINLNWFAMTFPVKEQQYTVAYFEDPALPKPSLYSERPYGRFGAFFKTTIDTDQPLTLRYRLMVSAGQPMPQEKLQKAAEDFQRTLKDESQSE